MAHPPSTDSQPSAEAASQRPNSGPSRAIERSPSLVAGLLRTARPKQWVKNILVFAAPAAAGALFVPEVLGQALVAFLAFTLASVGTYFINDASDVASDRLHPKKRYRPIAAGLVPVPVAWAVAVVSIAAGLGLSYFLSGLALTLLIAGYLALTLSYSLYLKHVAVVDLGCVAAGFVLRMIAGGLATDIPISNWFLTVASFSSLFVVAGKRYAEAVEVGEGRAASRAVLAEYTVSFLRSAWLMSMAVAVAAYFQWAFERADAVGPHLWYQLSAIPWVLSMLRYALLLERGQGGAPEDVLSSDRSLQILGLIWLILFGLGVYDS